MPVVRYLRVAIGVEVQLLEKHDICLFVYVGGKEVEMCVLCSPHVLLSNA